MSHNTLTDLAITSLATARLTRLVTEDYITQAPRDYLLDRFPPADTKLGYLLTCPWCVSIYTAAIALALPKPVKSILAASYVTGVISNHN